MQSRILSFLLFHLLSLLYFLLILHLLSVRGCILAVVERTEEEYGKVLQSLDAHSTEYVDRLKDEPRVCQIIIRTQVRTGFVSALY